MVYRTKSNTSRAFVAFEVEGRTFSYASDIGSHYCPVDLDATAKSLAEIWCREPVQSAVEISPKEVLKAGYRPDPSGNYPNGCLVDSLLHFTRLPDLKPEADWEGVFVLFAGVDDWHTDHALLIYFVGPVAWVTT